MDKKIFARYEICGINMEQFTQAVNQIVPPLVLGHTINVNIAL